MTHLCTLKSLQPKSRVTMDLTGFETRLRWTVSIKEKRLAVFFNIRVRAISN